MSSLSSHLFKYLRYWLTAANGKGHGIHSPFVFQFIQEVLNNNHKHFEDYDRIEKLRHNLLQNHTRVFVQDLGAGSTISKNNNRSIASIARHAAKPKKFGQLLFRVVKYYQPKIIFDLGTSLGITTSYLAAANPNATVITLEGVPSLASIAKQNFKSLDLKNIELVEGNFEDTLSSAIKTLGDVEQPQFIDFVFIDGNHRCEPTIRYFNQLLEKVQNDSIFIFDDIHWSGEMEQAWKTIQSHSSVRCTIDLFFVGIAFFRQEFKTKQHFVIRF
ncbi:MAG: class I SAM-dependent methyltransferase [Bacteroidota bacterium]|nr:class I SAM-dependent methyltransferase [Bacteroidota bacterium]